MREAVAMMQDELEKIAQAKKMIQEHIPDPVEVLMILGTGLGGIVDQMDLDHALNYKDIPGFPVSTAPSHAGRLVFGQFGGQRVAIMQGRLHLYEGWSARDIAFPLRVANALGVRKLVVTNAAGSLNPAFDPGDVMMITDHMNFTGHNPLIGPHDDAFGLRFPDMSDAYDSVVQKHIRQAFDKNALPLRKGIYAGITGPSLETSAERRFLRQSGGDAVGMSTVMEVIAAKQCGFQVAGLSAISNKADGGPDQQPDTIEEVLEIAALAGSKILKVLPDLIQIWSHETGINNSV
ncbi:MAG: purine-nucleoside phosphorylase [Paracoccaceae bacterium]